MNEYILIFRHEDGHKIASPEQMEIWMKQTLEWIRGIESQGKFKGGNGLPFDDARVITTKNGKPLVTNGPYGEIKETIGGYIIVEASGVEDAIELAKGCPVLQGEGNSVEVRRIAHGDGIH